MVPFDQQAYGNKKTLNLTHSNPVLLFYTPWKYQKTFSDVFRGYGKATSGCNGLNLPMPQKTFYYFTFLNFQTMKTLIKKARLPGNFIGCAHQLKVVCKLECGCICDISSSFIFVFIIFIIFIMFIMFMFVKFIPEWMAHEKSRLKLNKKPMKTFKTF